MSVLSIAHYFPFCRIRVIDQAISAKAEMAQIDIVPDKRFHPICHQCRKLSLKIHSREERIFRNLNFASTWIWLHCHYRKVFYPSCKSILTEELELFIPYQRVTKRLACYIHELCKVLTAKEVADHMGLNWKTVRKIDKLFLEEEYGQTDYQGLRILAVAN